LFVALPLRAIAMRGVGYMLGGVLAPGKDVTEILLLANC
jgi:hypothetical protein